MQLTINHSVILSPPSPILFPFMQRFYLFLFFYALHISSGNSQQIDAQKVDIAIEKGIKYFQNKCEKKEIVIQIQPIFKPLVDYYKLEGLNNCFSIENTKDSIYLSSFGPIYGQKTILTSQHKNLEWAGIDSLTLFALYGPEIMSNKKAIKKMKLFISEMNYEMTHSYLAILLLENTQFIKSKKLEQIKAKNVEALYKQLSGAKERFTDIEIECMAFLLYGGHSLEEEYIARLLSTQEEAGSWLERNSASDEHMRDHTSILALWTLLEWKYKDDRTLFLAKRN